MTASKDDVRDFLTSRRAKVTPAMLGLPDLGTRRVPGLRRGEVAILAGVSVEYYTKVERGDLRGVSDEVLEAIATALRMDDAERAHLFDLARAANAGVKARRRAARTPGLRPELRHLIDAMGEAVAIVGNPRGDIVAANALGRALYSPMYERQDEPVNYGRFIFLDPAARTFYPNWEEIADGNVATMRTAAGRDPFDRALSDLIGELSTRSEDFRTRWARHDVRLHQLGRKRIVHPEVGLVELDFTRLELPADPGLDLTTYTAPPGSDSEEKLRLLASWWASRKVTAGHSSA
ncbi:helix-turn-helix transcriptional regulator [Demequina silvatica]|uniref:helix-turn-helix transcriptional regulator n=1 Tax=Demequina silvatica TaxID=1638988 RepID=UPI0007835412|nr:helix-turn-helix transcriptional regulator [Demequina silvatica]